MSDWIPEIIRLEKKKLIGFSMPMSIANNLTQRLWQTFVPRLSELKDIVSENKYSIQVYPHDYFDSFDPNKTFVKWAAIEISKLESIPDGFDSIEIPDGLYAVFHYKGSSTDTSIFQYIYTKWLPNSIYTLDDRPHFEKLGNRYKNNDPESEEDIWIPIAIKTKPTEQQYEIR